MTNLDAIREIAAALEESGFWSLDEQADALGLPRSTAYTIMRCTHKIGRLNPPTIRRMLASSGLPRKVRQVIDRYVSYENTHQE